MQHLDEGTIHAWLDGALDDAERARVDQHVAGCASCERAVAEARGLVAGASRILSALDGAPRGVIPASMGDVRSIATRKAGRSAWRILRFTPARAAAAALLIVAAGTTLVWRHQRTKGVADLANFGAPAQDLGSVAATAAPDTARVEVQRTTPRMPAAGLSAVDERGASRAKPSPPARSQRGEIAQAAEGVAANAARGGRPGGLSEAFGKAAGVGRAARADTGAGLGARVARRAALSDTVARVAQEPARLLRVFDSTRRNTIVDSTRRTSTVRAEAPLTGGVAGGVTPAQKRMNLEAVVATSVPRATVNAPSLAPSPNVAEFAAQSLAAAGCYAVVADSGSGLPARLRLDTAVVVQERSREVLSDAAPRSRSAAPPSAAAAPTAAPAAGRTTPALARRVVSDVSQLGVTRPLFGASWVPMPAGGAQLTFAGPEARTLVLVREPNGLRGTLKNGERAFSVRLERIECQR
jgi:hypothetical protein